MVQSKQTLFSPSVESCNLFYFCLFICLFVYHYSPEKHRIICHILSQTLLKVLNGEIHQAKNLNKMHGLPPYNIPISYLSPYRPTSMRTLIPIARALMDEHSLLCLIESNTIVIFYRRNILSFYLHTVSTTYADALQIKCPFSFETLQAS